MERGYLSKEKVGIFQKKKTDRCNVAFCGEIRNSVNIDLVKCDPLNILRHFFNDKRNKPAHSTPLGIKVDEEEFTGLELGSKVL